MFPQAAPPFWALFTTAADREDFPSTHFQSLHFNSQSTGVLFGVEVVPGSQSFTMLVLVGQASALDPNASTVLEKMFVFVPEVALHSLNPLQLPTQFWQSSVSSSPSLPGHGAPVPADGVVTVNTLFDFPAPFVAAVPLHIDQSPHV
jgi:hypothetical protein